MLENHRRILGSSPQSCPEHMVGDAPRLYLAAPALNPLLLPLCCISASQTALHHAQPNKSQKQSWLQNSFCLEPSEGLLPALATRTW